MSTGEQNLIFEIFENMKAQVSYDVSNDEQTLDTFLKEQ